MHGCRLTDNTLMYVSNCNIKTFDCIEHIPIILFFWILHNPYT